MTQFSSFDCRETVDGIAVKVRVQPRASRSAVVGISGDSLKVCLTSPPVDGEANQACIKFFAELLGVAKSRVIIVNGEKSRNKLVKIIGITMEQFKVAIIKFI